jgi:hypothetical protein
MTKGCCANCFGNLGLAKEINSLASFTGDCSYCTSRNVPVINPTKLGDNFRALLDSYEENTKGRLLVQWMRDDWAMFSDPKMDDAHAKELLGDILNDGEIVRKLFTPVVRSSAEPISRWEALRQELMHNNRFFPNVQIELDTLRNLFQALVLQESYVPTKWYRARIQTEDQPFSIDKMGAPPPKMATHGRANPAGIPYLYVASDKATAISEVRPHAGEKVCVAEFTTPPNLRLIDLRHPRRSVSPFALVNFLPDESSPGQSRLEIAFLQRLGDELTQPVLPTVAAFEYAPSQYLCEFIKQCGYDGVIYRSSIGQGMNLALFQPKVATSSVVERHVVCRVRVEFSD